MTRSARLGAGTTDGGRQTTVHGRRKLPRWVAMLCAQLARCRGAGMTGLFRTRAHLTGFHVEQVISLLIYALETVLLQGSQGKPVRCQSRGATLGPCPACLVARWLASCAIALCQLPLNVVYSLCIAEASRPSRHTDENGLNHDSRFRGGEECDLLSLPRNS